MNLSIVSMTWHLQYILFTNMECVHNLKTVIIFCCKKTREKCIIVINNINRVIHIQIQITLKSTKTLSEKSVRVQVQIFQENKLTYPLESILITNMNFFY